MARLCARARAAVNREAGQNPCAEGAGGLQASPMKLFVVGIDHRTSALAAREPFAALAEEGATAARRLAGAAGVSELLLLATCNRFEAYGVAEAKRLEATAIVASLEELARQPPLATRWYLHEGEDAARHLFRVASGLDAMVVGETEVLGQLKLAYQRAWEEGTAGPVLHRALHRAFHVAKRVHTESSVAQIPVSIASIAAAHAARLARTPERARAVVVGSGEMGRISARHLVRKGFARVAIAGRTAAHADDAAAASGATAIPWEELGQELGDAKVLIAATASERPLLDRRFLERALAARRGRPLHAIDLGVPRNIADDVGSMRSVRLLTIDDLKPAAEKNLRERREAAQAAERLVAAEALRFAAEIPGRRCSPTIGALDRKFRAISQREAERLLRTLPELSPSQRKRVERAFVGVAAKALRDPAAYARDESHGEGNRLMAMEVLQRLFRLEIPSAPHPPARSREGGNR